MRQGTSATLAQLRASRAVRARLRNQALAGPRARNDGIQALAGAAGLVDGREAAALIAEPEVPVLGHAAARRRGRRVRVRVHRHAERADVLDGDRRVRGGAGAAATGGVAAREQRCHSEEGNGAEEDAVEQETRVPPRIWVLLHACMWVCSSGHSSRRRSTVNAATLMVWRPVTDATGHEQRFDAADAAYANAIRGSRIRRERR